MVALAGAAMGTPRPIRHHSEAAFEREAGPHPSTYKAPPSPPVVFVGATILDGTGTRIDNGELILASGKVQAIGHNLPRPAGATVIDAKGK